MDRTEHSELLLIGAGKMGRALLGAWLNESALSPANAITVVEPDSAFTLKGPTIVRSLQEVSHTPKCIFLAVKPQSLDALMPSLAQKFGAKPLYVSIAAGKTIEYFEKYLKGAAIVRAMPNTPALIGKAITVLCANARVTDAHKKNAQMLFEAAGEVLWMADESQMNAVTALSGSGPAYVYLFIEALVSAGKLQGLSESIAKQLALETIIGSAELAKISDEPLATLRQNVTSPGGTTEAALAVLIKNNQFKRLITDAVAHAVSRAKELA